MVLEYQSSGLLEGYIEKCVSFVGKNINYEDNISSRRPAEFYESSTIY